MDPRVVQFVGELTLTFAALFPVVNPIGDAPIFLGLTRRYPQSVQRMLARKIAAYGFALLAGSLLFGSEILNFFGVTLAIVQIAGGLVLANTGWHLLNQSDAAPAGTQAPATLEDAMSHAFYPLTLPITVGPGCITIAVAIGAHLRQQPGFGFDHGVPLRFVAALVGMALVCLLVVVCYGNAEWLARTLGRSGTVILVRLSAFILLAIGVQIAWDGLSTNLLELLSRAPVH
ncbi:MAG TPA: MarC family protein [bacterium]|nr:MarC family protein [bacterium]